MVAHRLPIPYVDLRTICYRLIAALACPWANRAIIVRRWLGLEDVIGLGLAAPTHDERSWTFGLDPDGVDPVLGIHLLREAYEERYPGYPKTITVPAMVDVPTGQVVTNDFARITLDFEQIKRHYYWVHTSINPTQVVPVGPDVSGWATEHGREELGGRPFGDGTPPAPITSG